MLLCVYRNVQAAPKFVDWATSLDLDDRHGTSLVGGLRGPSILVVNTLMPKRFALIQQYYISLHDVCGIIMDAATLEGCPAWWTSYIDPEEDNYEPCDARVLLCHKIMSHAPSWIASLGSFTFWGSDHALVPVNMAAFMAAFPHQDELHELLQETPEQVLSCLSACVHQVRLNAWLVSQIMIT